MTWAGKSRTPPRDRLRLFRHSATAQQVFNLIHCPLWSRLITFRNPLPTVKKTAAVAAVKQVIWKIRRWQVQINN